MPVQEFALDAAGNYVQVFFSDESENVTVLLNRSIIGVIPSREELRTARAFALPDGSTLRVQLVGTQLQVFRDEQRLWQNPNGVPPTSHKTRSWKNIRYLLLTLVLLLGVSLLMRYAPHSLTSTSNQATTTTNALLDHPYTAAVPGPGCDTGGANWGVGGYFKAPVTPTASTTIPVQGTPTLQVVTDNSVVTTCQQNGLLVKHTAHFDVFSNIFFDSNGLALPLQSEGPH